MANLKTCRGLQFKLSRALRAIPRFGRKLKVVCDGLRNHHNHKPRSTPPPIHPNQTELSISESITQPTLPTLPVETWEQVIDWLVIRYTPADGPTYNDNINLRRDLSSCALVCRAWRVRAQGHLFAFLRISGNGLSQYEALILKIPVLCTFARELKFYNQYMDSTTNQIVGKTVETASHAVRIAHKLPNVQYLMVDNINLAVEHSHLSRHIAALTNINELNFFSVSPTKLSQLARILIGLNNLSTLVLNVPIIVDPHPLTLPTPCYATKSSLTRLELDIQSGGHLLVDWLVKTKSFTTSLQILFVKLEDQIPQSEISLVMQGVQALLDNCTGSLKEWYFEATIQVDDFSSLPEVSLGSHKSLSVLHLRVSKIWFRQALEQVRPTTSKYISEIFFWYSLGEDEKPCNDLWKDLDVVLNTDAFKQLIGVDVACVCRDSNRDWYDTDNFEKSEFPTLLPNVSKKGILTY